MKRYLLERTVFFHAEIVKIALMFFCAIQLAYKILKNFHCDAIIGLPWSNFACVLRLTLTIAEKVKPRTETRQCGPPPPRNHLSAPPKKFLLDGDTKERAPKGRCQARESVGMTLRKFCGI